MPKTLSATITLLDIDNLLTKRLSEHNEKLEKRILKEIDKKLKNYATSEETKQIVMDIVTQASDAILSGVEEMFKEYPKKSDVVLKEDMRKLASL